MNSRARPAPRRADRSGGGGQAAGARAKRTAEAPSRPPRSGSGGAGAGTPLWRSPALWSAVAALLLFLPTLRYDFVWDDRSLILQNPAIAGSAPLSRLLLTDFWEGSRLHSGLWRPLVSLSYWIDFRLFHGAPAGFHAMNVASHAAASGLVALALLEAGLPQVAALLAGLWFAWLPTHVEPVAFVSGRTDVYCTMFLVLAFVLDRRARRAGRRWSGVGAQIALALALLSKEVAIAFVPLLALAEWVEFGPRGLGESARWLLPSLAVSGIYLIAHALVVPPAGVIAGVNPAMSRRVWIGTWLEFPGHLAFLWPWASHAPGPVARLPFRFASPDVVASVLFQAAFVAAIAILAARRSPLAVPAALVWLPFLPMTFAGLVNGRFLFAERFAYLPSVGVAWLVGRAVAAGLGRRSARSPAEGPAGHPRPGWPGWVTVGIAAGLAVGGLIESALSIPAWRDERALFGTMAARRPENSAGRCAWGKLLAVDGKLDEALAQARAARALGANLDLADELEGWVELRRGNWERAIAVADHALAADSTRMDAYLIRGKALMELGRHAEAGAMLEPLVRDFPLDVGLGAEWGRWVLLQGRASEALPFLERAARDPEIARQAEVHYELGMAHGQLGRMQQACVDLQKAVTRDPSYYDAWLRLALAYFTLGRLAARDSALAHAALLPEARDGRIETLRRQMAEVGRPPAAGAGRR